MVNKVKNSLIIGILFGSLIALGATNNINDVDYLLKFDYQPNLHKDSATVYIDGKKINSSLKVQLSSDEIDQSFVLFGSEIKKEFGSESILVILSKENKDSQGVKEFLRRIKEVKLMDNPTQKNHASSLNAKQFNSADPFELYRKNGEDFAYIIKPTEFNNIEFERISKQLKNKGFDLQHQAIFTDGELKKLTVSIKGKAKPSIITWEKNPKSLKSIIVVTSNTQSGICLVDIMD